MFVSPDDADAGEIKKNQKPVRRGRKQAASNKNELKPGWEEPRNSSGDEGEEPVHTCPTPPTTLMDVTEGEGDPKTGNTCNALSGDRMTTGHVYSITKKNNLKKGQIIEIILLYNIKK